jgi:hypothetical protein
VRESITRQISVRSGQPSIPFNHKPASFKGWARLQLFGLQSSRHFIS